MHGLGPDYNSALVSYIARLTHMRLIAILTLALASIGRAFGASVYVDNAATGLNNGTSWANAYTSFPTAAQIAPGDTVWISGGTTSKVYASTLTFVESGTSANWLKYRIGQDAGHNGVAIFQAISFESFRYIELDGSRSPSFVKPSTVWGIDLIKANQGFQTTRTNGLGIYLNGAAGQDNKIRWVNVGPHGTTNNIGDIHGLTFNNLTTISNLLIEYCWFHDIQNDAINQDSSVSNPEYFDALTVRWCIIENTGDDGVQWSRNGLNLNHCFLRDHWYPLYNGHPDQLQLAGRSMRYLKIWNNIFRNKANSLIIAEHFAEEGGLLGPMLIAGNIFYNTRDWIWNDIQAYGATFSAWRENTNVSAVSATWTNLHVVNNTVYGQHDTPFKIGRSDPSGSTRSVWDLRLYGSVMNNLFIDNKSDQPNTFSSVSLAGDGDYNPSLTNQVGYSVSEFVASNNIVAGANKTMTYHGVQGTNAEVHGMGNVSTMPTVETNTYTMEIAGNDTVAKDHGLSLVALASQFPEINTDLTGRPRGFDGLWDIGAREAPLTFSTQGLVLWLKFDDDLSDGIATDSSPKQNHGKHFGYLNDQVASNRFPISITMTNPYTDEVSGAAFFQRIEDGWGIYGESGRYVVITNTTDVQDARKITVCSWVYYQPYSAANAANFDIANNPRWFSTGYAYSGGLAIGLFGNAFTQVRFYTNNGSNADTYLGFGAAQHRVSDSGSYQGYSTNWAHIGWTYDADANVAIHYLNGIAVATNTQLQGVSVTVRGPSGVQGTGWIMIGGDNHNGRPALTPEDDNGDQYPNHAWFTGGLSKFMIFARVVPPEEMWAITRGAKAAGDFSYGGGGGGGGGGGSGIGKVVSGRATQFNVGRLN